MAKNTKCINIFDENKKNLNFYVLNFSMILLITLGLVLYGIFRYTQLNAFLAENKDVLSYNINRDIKNEDTQQCNINLLEMKDLCSIIGIKNIENITMNSEEIYAIARCKDLDKLNIIKRREYVSDFNINSIKKKEGEYIFEITYKKENK